MRRNNENLRKVDEVDEEPRQIRRAGDLITIYYFKGYQGNIESFQGILPETFRDFLDNLASRACECCKIIKKVEKGRGKKYSLKISCSVLISQ